MQTANYANRYVQKFNWALLPIKPNSKLPLLNDWGNNTQSTGDMWLQQPDLNIGLELGKSGMCSLDIDCLESFILILDEFGIPHDELAKYPSIVGNPKGKRIMFKMPDEGLPYAKLNWPSELDPDCSIHKRLMSEAMQAKNDGDFELEDSKRQEAKPYSMFTVFELRSGADRQRYDMLPPSLHPETQQPYRWEQQPAASLDEWPEPPPWLISIWQAWGNFKPQLKAVCPWLPESDTPVQYTPSSAPASGEGSAPVKQRYVADNPIEAALQRYGYKQIGKRWLSPHSGTGLPGVHLFTGGQSCWIHHASDPLCSDDSGHPVNAYDLYAEYEHRGDHKAAIKTLAKEYGMTKDRPTPKPLPSAQQPEESMPPEPVADRKTDDAPFKALGYNGAHYYYLSRGTEQVIEIRRGAHTSAAEMLGLCSSLAWWEHMYPKEKGGCDWQLAASECIKACERAGLYSEDRERGRGSWFDNNRSVMHLGHKLIVDGQERAISDIDSSYIYTKRPATENSIAPTPATTADGQALIGIFDQLNWYSASHAMLACGFAVLAPICGSLKWRPHLWLTAQRGAGKSWSLEHIFSPVMGNITLGVQGSTTEAGIRQQLRSDARPILFDEAEGEDKKGANRMKMVIELARQASSDTGADIVKGSASGNSMSFKIRSMFMLGSINVALSQAADESRFSVVMLKTPEKTAEEANRFEAYAKEVHTTLTDDFCSRIRARTYSLIPAIRQSAQVLAKVIATSQGVSQRTGDQVGTLMAGFWSLYNDTAITEAEALTLTGAFDFTDADTSDTVSDESSCLNAIMQHQIRVDTGTGIVTRSVGELVTIAYERASGSVLADTANETLARHGIKLVNDEIYISNTHIEIKRILSETAWGASWKTVLARIPGAYALKKPARFAGSTTRAVSVPVLAVTE